MVQLVIWMELITMVGLFSSVCKAMELRPGFVFSNAFGPSFRHSAFLRCSSSLRVRAVRDHGERLLVPLGHHEGGHGLAGSDG